MSARSRIPVGGLIAAALLMAVDAGSGESATSKCLVSGKLQTRRKLSRGYYSKPNQTGSSIYPTLNKNIGSYHFCGIAISR